MKYISIITVILIFIISCSSDKGYQNWNEVLSSEFDVELKPFYHGVASGDPKSDAVIIWTRVTPEKSLPSIDVKWEVSTSKAFEEVKAKGIFTTDPGRDYTVKVDVTALDPGMDYYYRFEALGARSITGRTKTAPLNTAELDIAVVSCSNYEWGYFNSYQALAKNDKIDVVLHLGDYIYEYGPGTYGDTTFVRKHMPAHEILSIADYRIRYSQYRLDADLRAAHARHPFINIWDDHEIANNSYQDGAQNHQEEEGDYEVRKDAAVKVFYEWLPIRETENHYRSFKYGDLAEIFMLDERLEGRTRPADSLTDPLLQDPSRSMLGKKQLNWLKESMLNTSSQWKIIGNQVIYSYLNWAYEPDFTINLDSWDGYPFEQKEVADHIINEGIENVVFVTGDTHSSWAFEVAIDPFNSYNQQTGEGAFALEFGTPSINSANSNEGFPTDSVIMHENKIVNSEVNPHLKYANLRDHGYLLISLDQKEVRANWYFVTTVLDKSSNAAVGKSLVANQATTTLQERD